MKGVIITGASGGLGSELDLSFAKAGWFRIRHHFRSPLRSVTNGLEESIQGDLQLFGTLDDIASAAVRQGASVLINNAGIYSDKEIEDSRDCDYKKMIEINLLAPIYLTRRIWPLFKELGGGIIININSLAGKDGGFHESAYCAAKHGLAGFSKALQFEGTKDNIRIIDVFLGAVKTPMSVHRDQSLFMDPIEIADIIYELASQDPETIRITEITINRRNY